MQLTTTMSCDGTLLGPFISRLPTELLLEILLGLCASSQREYATLLLVSRTLRDICRLTCLPVISVVLETPEKAAQFAEYLTADEDVAPLVRRLWIVEGYPGVVSKCTNLVALACEGLDLLQITSCDTFQHRHLVDLTFMGSWRSWVQFWQSKHAQVLCGQLEKLWLLDYLTIQGMKVHWLSALKELIYWSMELLGAGVQQFKKELRLLDVLPELRKLTLIMLSPSHSVFSQVQEIGDPRLEVVSWGERNEVTEWVNRRM